jgi:hypothetical protein
MTTESYIRDRRFEAHGAAIRWGWASNLHDKGEIEWFDEPKLRDYLRSVIDWDETAILAHHAAFDGLILSHHYGVRPKFWFDTLSMARLVIGNHLSVGLDSLAKHFGLAAKNIPYNLFRGKHWYELSTDVQKQVADGCCHDVALTWQLFEKFIKGTY